MIKYSSHSGLRILDGIVSLLSPLLDLLSKKRGRQHGQLRLPPPHARHVEDDAGVDDVWVHHLEREQVRVERLADEDGVGREEATQLGLHVGQGGRDALEHLFRDARVAGHVAGDVVRRHHQAVVHDLK